MTKLETLLEDGPRSRGKTDMMAKVAANNCDHVAGGSGFAR